MPCKVIYKGNTFNKDEIESHINDFLVKPEKSSFIPNKEYVQPESAFRTLDYGDNKGREENKPAQDKIENEILEDKPIGNTGDKLSTFIQRVIPAFQGMLKDAEHNTVLVTHSSVIKALRVWEDMGRPDVNNIDIKDFARRYVDLKPEKEGEVAAFKGDNGKDIKVVRHGETEDNVASEFRTDDTPLTDKGIAQARTAGQNIMKSTGGQVPKIVTSDLPRAVHTSDVIRQQLQGTKGGLNPGDMVISKHFEGPQQIRSVSEDGKSVYIEGQDHHVHEIPIEDITLKIKNNASTVRGDQGQVQEGGDAPEGRQKTRSNDLQQHPEETPVNAKTEQQAGGDDGKITGIAQRVQEQLGLRKYEKGEGWTPEEAFAFGKAAIAQGADPEKAMTDPHYANLDLDQRLAIAQAHNYTLHNEIIKAENDHGIESEQYKDAVKKQDDYLKLVQPLKTESSRAFTAQQGGIDLDTGSFTSVKKVVEKKTGGPLTKEQSDKVLELTNKNKDLQSKVSDLEGQLKKSIDETLKTEPATKSSKQIKKTAQEIAGFIRKGKISRPDAFSAATPASLVWDAMIEVSAKTVEAGGTIAQAIADGIEQMKKSDWYNGLTEDKKKNATNAFTEYIEDKAVDKKEMANIRRMEKELSDLESGVAKQKDPKRALSDREKELQDQIFEAKKNLGLIKSRPVKEPKIKLTEEQNKLGRLQKQLDDLLSGNVKDKPKISEDSPEAKAIKDQIFEAKKNLGLIKPKQELDSIEDFEKGRDELAKKFIDKKGNKFTPDEASDIWDYMKRNYLDKNVNFRDAIVQVANDTGLSFEQVSNAIVTPKSKRISDAMWKKRYDLEKNRQATQRYVDSQGQNGKINLFKKIANSVREITVFGHGGVFVGTHAGMTLMDLPRAKHTIKSFFNAYKLAYGKDAYYQKSMEELKASPNYKLAQRSGLKNNPDIINNDAEIIQPIFGRISESGKRGFNAIKILRQDLFDAHYNALSGDEKADPNAAVSIAKIVNNATGASNLKIPDWVNEVTFAGGMEASRWGKLTRNPIIATKTALTALFKPESVSIEDRVFAKVWSKRVGTQLASYLGLLTINAAIQNSLTDDPKKKVNLLDPTKSDWLKMKIGDTTFDFTSGMLSTLHFIESIAYQGFSGNPVYKDESLPKSFAETGYKYALGKLSPFYGDVVEAATRHDYNGNTLPWSDAKPLHKFNHKMTWGEYITSKSPLPVAEGFKTFYEEAHEQGVDKDDLDNILTGLKYGFISGTTGFKAYETPQKQTGGSTEGGGASGSFKIKEYH